ncbi:hypothetical protein Gbem_1016 [Citrifermentans bemidjiense Bem]|uniref:Uncharacterized protein n=1 Tax=Citrifermentans bemidjiense (strain ATCC BAA-1014 / DSM 16622 / JCM 12645 / Bem) TaxID=404380 RepID=B5EGH2_CITBB|nr:hypothetical protein [Citrifermentans bemidjiense]ACH38037.1 hypothetical protein Gbem_1016 [Citrifermentans bemidjiense Bem]
MRKASPLLRVLSLSIKSTQSTPSIESKKQPQRTDRCPLSPLEKTNNKPVDAGEGFCYNHHPLTNAPLVRQRVGKKALTAENVFAIKSDFAAQIFATE